MMQVTSTTLGGILVVSGAIITAFHSERLFADKFSGKNVRSHLSYALIGIIMFSIGNNLIANGIHDRLLGNPKT